MPFQTVVVPDAQLASWVIAGGLMMGHMPVNKTYDLHGKTLVFTTPSKTITFSGVEGLRPGEVLKQVNEGSDGTIIACLHRELLVFRLATPGPIVLDLAASTALPELLSMRRRNGIDEAMTTATSAVYADSPGDGTVAYVQSTKQDPRSGVHTLLLWTPP